MYCIVRWFRRRAGVLDLSRSNAPIPAGEWQTIKHYLCRTPSERLFWAQELWVSSRILVLVLADPAQVTSLIMELEERSCARYTLGFEEVDLAARMFGA